jgi:hypothetical protein
MEHEQHSNLYVHGCNNFGLMWSLTHPEHFTSIALASAVPMQVHHAGQRLHTNVTYRNHVTPSEVKGLE